MEKVKVYNCEVRHGGNIEHSQFRERISDREIRVLRAIHGQDGVVNVADAGEKDINQREEAFELALRYSKTSNPRHGRALVERVLNISLEGFDKWLIEREELAAMERKEKRDRAQAEAAEYGRAREAAEARVRAEIAERRVAAGA